jgi:hypothetical protein
MSWGLPVEIERRNRIAVALWAHAYEVRHMSLVPDSVFDEWALRIRPDIDTGRPELDAFFRQEFSPHTGMWVHRHPERHNLDAMFHRAMERGMTFGYRVQIQGGVLGEIAYALETDEGAG